MTKNSLKLLIEIYITFFKLGSISFGGGYSMIPLIEHEVVDEKKWLDKDKIIDVFAISQSIPGAIAMNASGFVGYSIAGIPGAIAAMIGNVTPSVVIVLTLVAVFSKISTYPIVKAAFRGVYPVIVSMIAFAAYKIGKTAIQDLICAGIAIIAFGLILFLNFDPIVVIILSAAAGLILALVNHFQRFKKNHGGFDDGGSGK
jgi:chromate transporter